VANKIISGNLILAVVLFLSSCLQTDHFPIGKKIICDAETKTADGNKFVAVGDSTQLFNSGSQQTDLQAYSGDYSVLTIPKTKAFGMTYTIDHVGADQFYKVSVWRKSKDGVEPLVAAASDPKLLYLTANKAIDTASDGWEKLEIILRTPPVFDNEKLSFYVWNNGNDSVFFDNLTIERLVGLTYPKYKEKPIVIEMDTTAYRKIYKKRKKAFESGILESADNDWVKGFMFQNDEMMKIKLRLKGDWLDHLAGDKWSYRIKMRKGGAWNRLRTFSIQTPEARDYIMEWMAHKLYQSQDVLTTRYGFVPVIFNRQPKGLYAWEEHFQKQLLEWRNRREGPILKFSEDAFWQVQKLYAKEKRWSNVPFFESANILPFGEGSILENPTLYNEFLHAQQLMYQYKSHTQSPTDIFDLDRLAAYYAMLDLTHARHGMAWHNQRFYYNPVISKLEPIAFDGYTAHEDFDLSINDNLAHNIIHAIESKPEEFLYYNLFGDSAFVSKYLFYLDKISQENTIDEQMAALSGETKLYDSLLRLEFPYYRFDSSFFKKSAQSIQNYLPQIRKELAAYLESSNQLRPSEKMYVADSNLKFISPAYFVHAYIEKTMTDSLFISVHNYYPEKIILLGTSDKSNFIYNYFSQTLMIDAYKQGLDGTLLNLKVDTLANFLFFKRENSDEVFDVPIYRWPYPSGITPRQELFQNVNLTESPYVDHVDGTNIFIKKDSLLVDSPIIIPEGFRVYFQPGTVINLINQAMFISCSPIFMEGTPEQPITITSSDSSANGFTILQAKGKSIVKNTTFENLNTLNYKGWTLTGAVTFYESDVEMNQVTFIDNHCEDALNVVRSEFVLNHSSFSRIFGDAFDSDFSKGQVLNTDFNLIGNDAIDFSGSQILISRVNISQANDKGVSGGEDSHLTLDQVDITDCNIGLASKDLSILEVDNSTVNGCKYGLVLLQKKPEYGPASMVLKNSKITDSEIKMLIEIGSLVNYNGQLIKGDISEAAKLFY